VVAILGVVVGLLSYWEQIHAFPGVSSLIAWMSQERLPRVNPEHFAIAIAHLEHDENTVYERRLWDVLGEFEGVKVFRFDRTISLTGAQRQEVIKAGHDKARQYLKRSGAHVLIWGEIHGPQGNKAPRLFWTTSQADKSGAKLYKLDENLQLPELFWSDLAEVLRLMVVTQSAEFLAQKDRSTGDQLTPFDRFIADQLGPFVKRVRELVHASWDQPGWSAESRARIRVILANALMVLGQQAGQRPPLDEAIATYRAALKDLTGEHMRLEWAMAQTRLGNALEILGGWEVEPHHLKQAEEAYRAALEQLPRKDGPEEWAMAQGRVGNALWRLGERELGTQRLEEAVAAYRQALEELPQKHVPFSWAEAQDSLGLALRALGKRKKAAMLICEALGTHVSVWELTSGVVPFYASISADHVKEDITTLQEGFQLQEYEECLKGHHERLRRMGLF
jgi:tetratricopeptide (TPR) repeat protein